MKTISVWRNTNGDQVVQCNTCGQKSYITQKFQRDCDPDTLKRLFTWDNFTHNCDQPKALVYR